LIAGAAAYGSQLVVFPEAFVGGYPRSVRFDATNPTEGDDGLQRYYASAIDVPGESPFDRLSGISLSVTCANLCLTPSSAS